jgi:hypothetical protein
VFAQAIRRLQRFQGRLLVGPRAEDVSAEAHEPPYRLSTPCYREFSPHCTPDRIIADLGEAYICFEIEGATGLTNHPPPFATRDLRLRLFS